MNEPKSTLNIESTANYVQWNSSSATTSHFYTVKFNNGEELNVTAEGYYIDGDFIKFHGVTTTWVNKFSVLYIQKCF